MSEQPTEQAAAQSSEQTKNVNFTDGESKLFVSIVSNLTGDIQFDADKVAAELGYKDGNIVKTRWGQIKRKRLTGDNGPAGGIKKRSPAKKGAKAKAETEGEGGDDEEAVKTPKKRGRKPKAAKAEEETPVKDEVVDEVAVMEGADEAETPNE
ncbi:uncharacterized protein LTR77_007107 [Saxophila tyrrhenica]|uniref:Uncharacterized protein n=1 Tax=Saxophila tyrrhenica TaxID=1690608 RepID=A0AAV9P3R7_9PEZI|nr:hypothetical protein LTR77_007107 [Saxophila tyrrhenica]